MGFVSIALTIFFGIIILLGIIAVVAILTRTPSGRGTGGRGTYFATWRARLPTLPGGMLSNNFLLNFGVIMLGVVALTWGIYLTGWVPGMFTFWGVVGLLTFYGLIGLTIAAAQSRTGTTSRVAYRLALAAAIVVGAAESIHYLFGCDEACQLHKQQAAGAQARIETQRQIAVEQARYPGCNRQKTPVRFDTQPVRINPNAQCSYDLWYSDCIYVQQAGNKKVLGPFCPGKTYSTLPVDVEYVWSAGTAFNGYAMLSPPRYTSLFR